MTGDVFPPIGLAVRSMGSCHHRTGSPSRHTYTRPHTNSYTHKHHRSTPLHTLAYRHTYTHTHNHKPRCTDLQTHTHTQPQTQIHRLTNIHTHTHTQSMLDTVWQWQPWALSEFCHFASVPEDGSTHTHTHTFTIDCPSGGSSTQTPGYRIVLYTCTHISDTRG